ncbi:MAG: hypothetical protein ACI8SE_000677 [Bacteroidia bacterium]
MSSHSYVVLWYNNTIYRVAGSGIIGTKSNNCDATTEFQFIQAMYVKDNKLLLYDETVSKKKDRHVVFTWEIDFELPDQP